MKDQKQLLLKSLKNDVPVFVICGTDANAIKAMESYYKIAEEHGCDKDFLEDVKLKQEDFKAFLSQEPEKVKLPDMSPQIEESIYSIKEKKLPEKTPELIKQTTNENLLANFQNEIDEINNCLKYVQRTGLIKDGDNSAYINMNDSSKQYIDDYFASLTKKLDRYYNCPIEIQPEYEWIVYEAQAGMQLRAGDLLESKGLLSKGSTEAMLAENGWNITYLRDREILEEIANCDNALSKIYELHGIDEDEVYNFLNRTSLTESFCKANNSAIEVSDHDRFVSNYYVDFDTTKYPSRDEIEKNFEKAKKTAFEDNIALKQAVSEKISTPLLEKKLEANEIFQSKVASAILLTGGKTEKEIFDVFVSRMKNDHEYDFEVTKSGNYSFTSNSDGKRSRYVIDRTELDLAIKSVINPNHKLTPNKELINRESNEMTL